MQGLMHDRHKTIFMHIPKKISDSFRYGYARESLIKSGFMR